MNSEQAFPLPPQQGREGGVRGAPTQPLPAAYRFDFPFCA